MTDQDRIDELEEALWKIKSWSESYPIDIFPEPDLKKARALLEAGGITLDSVSAHCMRHVVEGVGKIARAALSNGDRNPSNLIPDSNSASGFRLAPPKRS